MDEIKLGQQQGRGVAAAALLESEMLKEAFAHLKAEYTESWRKTRIGDTVAREHMWWAVNIIDLVEEHLKKIVVNGRIATKDLANIKYLKR